MLTLLCMYQSLVSSDRLDRETLIPDGQQSLQNMTSTTISNLEQTDPFDECHPHGLLRQECNFQVPVPNSEFMSDHSEKYFQEHQVSALPSDTCILRAHPGHYQDVSNEDVSRKRDSETSSYHDARSSMSPELELTSQGEEEDDEEEARQWEDYENEEKRFLATGKKRFQSSPTNMTSFEATGNDDEKHEETFFLNDINDGHLGAKRSEVEKQNITPLCRKTLLLQGEETTGWQFSPGYDREGNDLSLKTKNIPNEDSDHQIKPNRESSVPKLSISKDNSSPPPLGRLARLGKALSPGQYQSKTLGRPCRKARHVEGPIVPQGSGRENRSKTEPPPELAPPDILQVSWVWETRSPTRSTSVKRRPSRKVSCRRMARPRLAPRKSSSSRGSNSPRRKLSVMNIQTLEEMRSYSPTKDHKVIEKEPLSTNFRNPDVASYGYQANTPTKRFLPCCDMDTVLSSTLPSGGDTKEVPLRENNTGNYLKTASRALRQKWRNSEIVMPRLLNETLENVKNSKNLNMENCDENLKNSRIVESRVSNNVPKPENSDSCKSRKRIFLERAKALPLQMRKLSYFISKSVKRMDHIDLYLEKPNNSHPLLIDLKKGLASHLVKRRKSMRRQNGTGIKRPSSFSPTNSLKRNYSINWSQKYQNVMSGRGVGGGRSLNDFDDEIENISPTIQVTEADDDDEAFVSDDNISTQGSIASSLLHPQFPKGGRGVLERIFNRIRPRSLSTSRSFASSRSSMSGGSEDGHSPSHSSDYEDQDDNERGGSASLVGRMRGLRRDMQKKISRLKSPRGSTSSSPGPLNPGDKTISGIPSPGHPSASSFESLPSSAPVASTAIGSNRSSLSGEEVEPYTGPFIGRARALVDCQPSPYDRDALKFKKGDIIDIIAKNPSGLWKGCVEGRVGHFKFILVEEEVERPARRSRPWRGTTPRRGRACTLEELLTRLHLGHLIQVFVLNGYEDLEQFRDIEKADLDCLGITDPETCAKILTAVALLHDADSEPEQDLPETLETTEAALRRGDHGRDSGCYTDHHRSTTAGALDENNLDTRQSTPSTDTSSGYHSRGAYNIPLGEATLTSRDDHSSALDSPSSESATTSVTGQSSTQSEPHSYRAHLATVLPASPRAKLRQNQQGESKQKQDSSVDFEAKYSTARSVFEKEVVKREVPFTVRPSKQSGSQSPTEEVEASEVKNESSVAITEETSP